MLPEQQAAWVVLQEKQCQMRHCNDETLHLPSISLESNSSDRVASKTDIAGDRSQNTENAGLSLGSLGSLGVSILDAVAFKKQLIKGAYAKKKRHTAVSRAAVARVGDTSPIWEGDDESSHDGDKEESKLGEHG